MSAGDNLGQSLEAMTALLDLARAAYACRDWVRASELFAAARAQQPLCADDTYALSDAAWWVGDNDTVFDAALHAYDLFIAEARPLRAAYTALDLAVAFFLRGDESQGAGWLGRSQRLLEHEAESAVHGYHRYLIEVEGPLGGIAPSDPGAVESLLAAARDVQDMGRRHGDRTLEAAGMLGEGRALVKSGRTVEGVRLLDETLVVVLTEELNPAWAGNIYCHLMSAADELGDLRRAREWTASTERWLAGMPAAVVFNGICRVHRARVHMLAGAWDAAEEEARRVCADLEALHTSTAAAAYYQVGEIRRLRGDHAGAAAAYERAHALGFDPQPGLALLRLAEGRSDVALASIRAAVLAQPNGLARAPLRAAQVEIAMRAGELDVAREASAELDDTAKVWPTPWLQVVARYARAAIMLELGRPQDALPALRDACRCWIEFGAPWECARVRVLLARAYHMLDDDDAAERELDAAAAAFERLGALGEARVVARLRRARSLPCGLTPREAEVLELVAAGGTNKRIAGELRVSEKTVARHLANIFANIGVTTRTAAASFAFEHGLAARGEPLSP